MAGLIEYVREVRDGEDASIASTRDARAPQNNALAEKHARSIDSVLRFWVKHALGYQSNTVRQLRTMVMIIPNRASESSRLRMVFCSVLFIAATLLS